MHKLWKTNTEIDLKTHLESSLNTFKQLSEIYNIKDNIDLNSLTQTFLDVTSTQPNTKLQNHLLKLAGMWMKRDGAFYQELMVTLTQKSMPNLQNDVLTLKKSLLCMYCDWHNQNFINLESLTITYKHDFCLALVENHIDTLYDKYNIMLQALLVLDEWVYLTSDQRLLKNSVQRAAFRRYILIIDQCKANPTIENCAPVCREFNLNKQTFMFDGEPTQPFQDFTENFNIYFEKLKANKEEVLSAKTSQMTDEQYNSFKTSHSVMSTKITINPLQSQSENSFGLQFDDQSKVNYFEHNHEVEDIQLKTLDTELNSFMLFEMNQKPVDITEFLILFDPYKGINLYDDSKITNMDLSADKLLSLLHHKIENPKNLDEFIEPWIRELLEGIQVKQISEFVNDYKITFKTFVEQIQQHSIDKDIHINQGLFARIREFFKFLT